MEKSNGSVFLMLAFLIVLLSGCASASTPIPHTPNPSSIVGEITEWGPLGQLSANFTGTYGGTEFKLKEYPDKIFQIITDSFEEAAKFGVMELNFNGVYIFQDITGWKVEITCEEVDDFTYRVTSLKRINP